MDASKRSRDLLVAKALFFSNAMSVVGWARFQNNFYLDHGLSSSEIGSVKALGLVLKFVGEPFWCASLFFLLFSFVFRCVIADLTNAKHVFIFCTLMQVSDSYFFPLNLLDFHHGTAENGNRHHAQPHCCREGPVFRSKRFEEK